MTIEISAVEALCMLCLLLIVLYGPWQWVCTDYARQLLFEKRDAIFDMGVRGELDFDSEPYRTFRSSLESLIRFGHEVTWIRFLFLTWSLKLYGRELEDKNGLATAIDNLSNEEVRKKVRSIFMEAYLTLGAMVFFKSPLIMMLVVMCSPFVVFGLVFASALGLVRRWWSTVERAVAMVGKAVQAEADLSPSAGVV